MSTTVTFDQVITHSDVVPRFAANATELRVTGLAVEIGIK